VPDPDGKPQAPHILIAVFGRGMLLHLYARIYFDGEADNGPTGVALVLPIAALPLIAVRERGNGNASIVSTSTCRATTRRVFDV